MKKTHMILIRDVLIVLYSILIFGDFFFFFSEKSTCQTQFLYKLHMNMFNVILKMHNSTTCTNIHTLLDNCLKYKNKNKNKNIHTLKYL